MGSKKIIRNIGIIPARGNSKSIKDKNLIKIRNSTLIDRIYKTAIKSKIFNEIICSTDSLKIINHCKKQKIKFIKRPKSLATDTSNVVETAIHALSYYPKDTFDYIYLLQPTCIMLRVKDLKNLDKLLKENSFNSAQTIHETPHNYNYVNSRFINKGVVKFYNERKRLKLFNKQKKEKTYHFGNMIVSKTKNLIKSKNFFIQPCGYILIDKLSSFDLDNFEDYRIAKKILN